MTIRYPSKNNIEVTEIHRNVSQELVEITLDRLSALISQHVNDMQRANGWQAALGIFITIVLVLLTTDFKDSFGIKADVWTAIFIIFAGFNLFWFVRSLYYAYKSDSIESLLTKIKNKQC